MSFAPKLFLFAGLLLIGSAATAQKAADDMPAVNTGAGSTAAPAVNAAAPKEAAPRAGGGTTIIGERESPIGLYITPWRNASAEADIDRPARLLSVEMTPLDRKVFARQVEYYEALAAARKTKTAVPAPAAP